jgi:hypothetical protein
MIEFYGIWRHVGWYLASKISVEFAAYMFRFAEECARR